MEDFPVGMHRGLKTDAWGAVELGDDDAFGAVDHKGSLRSHEGQLAHVDFFLFRAALVLVAEGDVQRRAVGLAFTLGIEGGELRVAQLVTYKIERGFVLKSKNRKEFPENRLKPDISAFGHLSVLLKKLIVRVDLELDEIWRLDGLLQFAEMDTFRHGGFE